jgi:hypothetical protein
MKSPTRSLGNRKSHNALSGGEVEFTVRDFLTVAEAGALLNTEPVTGAKSNSDFLSHLQLLALLEAAEAQPAPTSSPTIDKSFSKKARRRCGPSPVLRGGLSPVTLIYLQLL